MRPAESTRRTTAQTYMVTSSHVGASRLFQQERWAKLLVDTLYHYRGSAICCTNSWSCRITFTCFSRRQRVSRRPFSSSRADSLIVRRRSSVRIWKSGRRGFRIIAFEMRATIVCMRFISGKIRFGNICAKVRNGIRIPRRVPVRTRPRASGAKAHHRGEARFGAP